MKNTFAKISPFQVDPEKIMDTFGIQDEDFTSASAQEKESRLCSDLIPPCGLRLCFHRRLFRMVHIVSTAARGCGLFLFGFFFLC